MDLELETETAKDHDNNPLNLISLCSGYGGLDIGLSRATGGNVKPVAYCEREMYAAKNLLAKIEEGKLYPAPIWTDVKTFPFSSFHGKVDILSGGYPCQPFSIAGQRKGRQDPRHLWPYIAKGIRAARPSICFFENVEGHLSEGFREVSHSLRRLGYRVEAGIFSAAEVGAPHQRKRLFILGVDDSRGSEFNRISESIRSTTELSDYYSQRKQEFHMQEPREEESSTTRGFLWPARPNEQQHEWEEPRTKPKVGRSANGTPSRVDELRLLGNGVVPKTAEKAFVTLIDKYII